MEFHHHFPRKLLNLSCKWTDGAAHPSCRDPEDGNESPVQTFQISDLPAYTTCAILMALDECIIRLRFVFDPRTSQSKYLIGNGGIRTHAIEMTGALNQRLRPLGHATPYAHGSLIVQCVCQWWDSNPRHRNDGCLKPSP